MKPFCERTTAYTLHLHMLHSYLKQIFMVLVQSVLRANIILISHNSTNQFKIKREHT